MARVQASTKCPCGSAIHANARKPTRMDTLVIVLTCPACQSKFQLVGKIKPGSPEREFNCRFEILDLSAKACEALKPKAVNVAPIS